MNIFDVNNYREFIKFHLTGEKNRAQRGKLAEIAKIIGCHTTYLGQVMRGKSELSLEQGLKFCKYLMLTEEETQLFLNFLNYERAGNSPKKCEETNRR